MGGFASCLCLYIVFALLVTYGYFICCFFDVLLTPTYCWFDVAYLGCALLLLV